MKKLLLTCAAALMAVGSAWAETEWQTVWSADFSSAPSGMTYSVSSGSTNINAGYLEYVQGGGSGNRAINTAFTDNAFNVSTAWKMEFDIAFSSSNQNPSNVTFATNSGAVFTCTWEKYASAVVVTDASANELTAALPLEGYNLSTMNSKSHVTLTGDPENGVYLTIVQGSTTYVDNVLATSTFSYPKTLNGSLGRAVSHMMLDNVVFQTPKVAGFVAAPTYKVIGANGNSRILTLATITDGSAIKWSETAPGDPEDFSSWTTYNGTSLTTSASTIYAVAIKDSDKSEVSTIETGAGSTLSLVTPTVSVVLNNGIPTYTFASNNSSVLGAPVATLNATLNGNTVGLNNGSITPDENGTLEVTASAAGYANSALSIPVYTEFVPYWQSTDYSTLTDANAQEVLGENWTRSEGGRWASWNAGNEPYVYYGDGATTNITVEGNLRMRGVISLVLGYGLGRNITGAEAITMNGMQAGYIAGYKMYNGFGSSPVENANYTTYALATGTSTSVNTNNGSLLMQATIYGPGHAATIAASGYTTVTAPFNFTVAGGTPYYAASTGAESVTLTSVDEPATVFAAGTGLMIKGEPGATVTLTATSADATFNETNLLVGVTAADQVMASGTNYVLATKKEGNVTAFYQYKGEATPLVGKAYLNVAGGSASALRIDIEGMEDGMETAISLTPSLSEGEGACYDLYGRKSNGKGLMIQNGKVVLVK